MRAVYSRATTGTEINILASSEQIYHQIGNLIRAKRRATRPMLTQEELAHRVHLKRTSITNIERGRQKLLVHTLFEIAAALDVAPSALIPSTKENGDTIRELKGLKPDEREFARSVFSKSPSKPS
jgi:transcriptional regulator with XRE-family HTH domain